MNEKWEIGVFDPEAFPKSGVNIDFPGYSFWNEVR